MNSEIWGLIFFKQSKARFCCLFSAMSSRTLYVICSMYIACHPLDGLTGMRLCNTTVRGLPWKWQGWDGTWVCAAPSPSAAPPPARAQCWTMAAGVLISEPQSHAQPPSLRVSHYVSGNLLKLLKSFSFGPF